MTTPTPVQPDRLPTVVLDYLRAHTARDGETAARAFAPDAVVLDDGRTYRGIGEIRGFLNKAGAEFEYTTDLVGAERLDDEHWVAVQRLEGDFPGGVVELRYRFALEDGLVSELVIAP